MHSSIVKKLALVGAIALGVYGCSPSSAVSKPAVTANPESYVDVPYKKLGSEAFTKEFDDKLIHFKAMFVGEWTITQMYKMGGIDTDNRVFLNHRDVSYVAQQTGLGSSDIEFPPFALSLPKENSDIAYQLSRGEVFEVWGHANEASMPGKKGLHVSVDKIQKAAEAAATASATTMP